ncbi:Hypothetical protein AA314_07005 [Archangium gephyra]|uniref:Uncharacterized protein n=1 Tax=Archangium gephyra TaxID=48 RepID=A0AAC8QDL1_9BACT|nr:Hypothetical protein AA314_07005 [Archangium gephyra]
MADLPPRHSLPSAGEGRRGSDDDEQRSGTQKTNEFHFLPS